MIDIPFVKRKIGNSYLVWFQNNNLYFQLEEPAWFVFEKLLEQGNEKAVSLELSNRYQFDVEESMSFVKDIRLKIEEINKVEEVGEIIDMEFEDLIEFQFTPYSVYYYQFGTRVIHFSYETKRFERFIHPLIQHLETSKKIGEDAVFELFSFEDRIVFRLNNQVIRTWYEDESHLTKGRIFLELLNVLHEKTDADWLMTVHASAITNGRKTILFSAEPGSGKTTMAALLQAQGYHLISDDFVPFDKYSFNAYPFPTAMSVKEGATEVLTSHYPNLKERPLVSVGPKKNVRYFPIENNVVDMIFPAREIIFIKYDDTIDFKFEKLDLIDAIKQLFNQIWVPPSAANVEKLFDKIEQFSFFQLNYSNNQKALDAIKKLFEND